MSRSYRHSSFSSCYGDTNPGMGKYHKRLANHKDRTKIRTLLASKRDIDELLLPHKRECLDHYGSHKDGMSYWGYYYYLDEEQWEAPEYSKKWVSVWGHWGLSRWRRNMRK